MEGKQLTAAVRVEKGKNACRRLRSAGIIPAVLYSHGESRVLQIKEKEFFNLFKTGISESVIFDLDITAEDGSKTKEMAFVKDYLMDPIRDELVHLDLFKVTAGEAIHTQVDLEITGSPKGIKLGGILEVSEHSIEIECLPRDLPEKIFVDVTELMPGDSIHASDIELKGSAVLKSKSDLVIAAVHTARVTAAGEEAEEIEETAEVEQQ